MSIVRNKGYGQSQVGMIKIIIPPSKPAWEDWEIHTPPTEPVEDDKKIPDFITNTVWEDLEIIYPAFEDPVPAPPMPPKKTKKVWRKKNKTSSTATTSPWTKRPQPDQVWRKVLLFDPKLRASLEEVPSPKSTVSLYLLSIKFDKKLSKNKIKIYCFISLFHDAR